MQALLWRDYLCPWSYLGLSRTTLMQELGVEVTPLAYDLHPEVPAGGRPIRPGGRLDRILDHIATECATEDTPFRKPAHTPNTRRALEIAEVLRTRFPEAFVGYDDACYRVHWIEGGDLGDAATLRRLVAEAGAEPDAVEELVGDGSGARLITESMTSARELGVGSTPAWWVDDRLLVPGAQPRATVERWITRLLERSED